MKRMDVGSVPVCDASGLRGMITDRDIAVRAVAEGRDPRATRVEDVMTSDVVYGTVDQEVDDAARLMEQWQIRRLVVLDENKALVGVISLGDIALESGNRSLSAEALEAISQPGAVGIGAAGVGDRDTAGAGTTTTATTAATAATRAQGG
jgi:signal-transduction protein with cAMP-binding, CBS, and nucleotidyltransferase domain